VYFLKLQSKHMSSAGDLLTEKQAVQDALRTKEAFLSSASHQFRTPLNGIMASADLLHRNNPRADQQALIQPLRSSAADLVAMIHDILDVTQLEKGGLMIDLKELDIRTCLSEIIETYRDRATAKAIRYDVEFIGEFPATVMGDGDRITQILSKTLANAVHFTKSGGVSVSVSCRSFQTSCVIFVTIKDSGPGMNPEKLKSVFSDTHGSDGRMDAGLGLGLRIARHAARQMGGALSIDSTVGIGTTSKLTLNLTSVETKPAQPNWKLSEASILVAEDNKTNQLIVKKLLEPTGVKLHFADDGVAAVAGFQSLQPDLILMDLAMPNKTGLEATEEIRALEAGMSLPTTPIIALTANAFEEDRRNCERVGMNGFLTKPVNQKRLISELERAGQSRAL
ncbi:MAG: response regulator, partial [Pseudomonadota bacterium]